MKNILDSLKALSYRKLHSKLPKYKRFLFKEIVESKDNIIGIYGSRGVGKTTLLLQVAKELDCDDTELLYISCDHPLLQTISLLELVEYFYNLGGKCLLIDEIHEAKDFEQQLKSIYDFFDIKIIFSGSSAIKLTNPSFARRYHILHLPVLSLKEYLELGLNLALPKFSLKEILENGEKCSYKVLNTLKDEKILKHFKSYLDAGIYPFYFSNEKSYFQKIIDNLNITLYNDLGIIYNITPNNLNMLKKLLVAICVSKPMEFSFEKLAKKVGISRSTLYKYIDYLHRAELLRHITYEAKRFKNMQKPDKLYLSNTNLCKALCLQCEIDTIREMFFVNMVSFSHSIYYTDRGDFLLDEKYTFEVGGKNKSFNHIKDIENSFQGNFASQSLFASFVVADDIEIGFKNKTPLWLFGFLY